MKEAPPPDFDWVKARHECNVGNMLQRLKLQAKNNVETRNAQLPEGVGKFGFDDLGSAFSVWGSSGRFERNAVDVSLETGVVVFRLNGGAPDFKVTLTLDKYGQCKCRLGDEELDPWQVLKKALEPLL